MDEYIRTRSVLHRYVKSTHGFSKQRLTIFKMDGIDKIIIERLGYNNKSNTSVVRYLVYVHVGYKEEHIYVYCFKPIYLTALPDPFDSGKDVELTKQAVTMLFTSIRFFESIRLGTATLLEINCNTNESRKCLSITREYIDQLFEEVSDTINNLGD